MYLINNEILQVGGPGDNWQYKLANAANVKTQERGYVGVGVEKGNSVCL